MQRVRLCGPLFSFPYDRHVSLAKRLVLIDRGLTGAHKSTSSPSSSSSSSSSGGGSASTAAATTGDGIAAGGVGQKVSDAMQGVKDKMQGK